MISLTNTMMKGEARSIAKGDDMGYYSTRARHNTEAGRKDPKFVEIFDQMRDMEYTVAQARMIAWEASYFMSLHPDWTKEQAVKEALK